MIHFAKLGDVAQHLRQVLETKSYALIYAYNGTGKTRLSMEFKELGKADGNRDTLYFNAFTEDLFTWDNDLENDSERKLVLNTSSQFFAGLEELEMDNRIRPLLQRYADFDFRIETKIDEGTGKLSEAVVRFSREVLLESIESDTVDTGDGLVTASTQLSELRENIKISRGEENMFIWCFFLAIVQLAMDRDIEAYSWVRYVYIDDPISSLDENNAVAVAHHLARLFKTEDHDLKVVVSSHHTLFFNVFCNELSNAKKFFLAGNKIAQSYTLKDTSDTPFFYHVAMLAELQKAADTDELYTYHFSMLRIIFEKTASFHGFNGFSHCIKREDNDEDGIYHTRLVNILNHGNYSLFEPIEMMPENKQIFKKLLADFMDNFRFNADALTQLNNTRAEETA